jgi:hypothetical protein
MDLVRFYVSVTTARPESNIATGKIRKILSDSPQKYAIYTKGSLFQMIQMAKNMQFPTRIWSILGSKICKFPTYI